MLDYISTGCGTLDGILGKGLPLGEMSLIYGEPSTGKTSLALRIIVNFLNYLKSHKATSRVLYVDADQKLSMDRFSQISGTDAEGYLNKVVVSIPRSFAEQTLLVEQLEAFVTRSIDFVVIDTITSLYQEEISSRGSVFPASREFNRQLAYLKEAVEDKHLTVLLLSQVHSALQSQPPEITPISTRILKYWSDNILDLRLTTQTGVRVAFVEKPRVGFTGCRFRLTQSGLVDMGPAEPEKDQEA